MCSMVVCAYPLVYPGVVCCWHVVNERFHDPLLCTSRYTFALFCAVLSGTVL